MLFAKHFAMFNRFLWRGKYGIRRFFKIVDSNVRGLNSKPRSQHIIVSLTSIPSRIHAVPFVIDALLNQTMLPDKIILYLNAEEFTGTKFPQELLLQQKLGLEIIYCDNLKPHKKYFYSMQSYPEDIVLTVDDDLVYNVDLVEKLYKSYLLHPSAVSAMRARLITFDENNELKPYCDWHLINDKNWVGKESMSLLSTTGAGVLFPPHCLHSETFNKANLQATCLEADDLWLKVMEVMYRTPVVLVAHKCKLVTLKRTQEKTLFMKNKQGNNDKQMKKILALYNNYNGSKKSVLDVIRIGTN
jgi:hypothetical protein